MSKKLILTIILFTFGHLSLVHAQTPVQKWVKTFRGQSSATNNFLGDQFSENRIAKNAFAVDKDGNSYLTGVMTTDRPHLYVLKVNTDGDTVFRVIYKHSSKSGPGAGRGIVVDAAGNCYVTGYLVVDTVTSIDDHDIITMKLNSAGKVQWVKIYGGASNVQWDEGNAIMLDKDGNVVVAGSAYVSSAAFKLGNALLKYGTDGSVKWEKTFTNNKEGDYPTAIGADGSGNIYVAGVTNEGVASDGFITKYDASGNKLWLKTLNGSSDINDAFYDMTVDNLGNAYVTGMINSDIGAISDIVVARYKPDGTLDWNKVISGSSSHDIGHAISMNGLDSIYAVGFTTGTTGKGRDFIALKYDSTGAQTWKKSYDPKNGFDDFNYDIITDQFNNIYIVGVTNDGGDSFLISTLKYRYDGVLLWSRFYNAGGKKGDYGFAVGLDALLNIYSAGNEFVSGGATSDIVLIKNAQPGLIVGLKDNMMVGIEASVSPNPAHGYVTLNTGIHVKSYIYSVRDLNGKTMLSGVIPAKESLTNIKLDTVSKGVYFIKVESENTSYSQKLVIY